MNQEAVNFAKEKTEELIVHFPAVQRQKQQHRPGLMHLEQSIRRRSKEIYYRA